MTTEEYQKTMTELGVARGQLGDNGFIACDSRIMEYREDPYLNGWGRKKKSTRRPITENLSRFEPDAKGIKIQRRFSKDRSLKGPP